MNVCSCFAHAPAESSARCAQHPNGREVTRTFPVDDYHPSYVANVFERGYYPNLWERR